MKINQFVAIALGALAIVGLADVAVQAQSAPATAGDPVAGARTFGQCRVCHSTVANGADGVGPNLFGAYNSRAGSRRPRYV